MRLWVEILRLFHLYHYIPSASLWGCELKYTAYITPVASYWSASLWGCELKYNVIILIIQHLCQPPCEAVSWNNLFYCFHGLPLLSASLWGCELKYFFHSQTALFPYVSLLVRLWVEIEMEIIFRDGSTTSASLWGCELKYFFKSFICFFCSQPPCEAVSWNITCRCWFIRKHCQPPCEAVSWNNSSIV